MGFHAELDNALIEELAEAAHEAFCAELRAKGYRYGRVNSDSRKEYSSLIPYADLSDEEKEQNRNNVRDIPRKLSGIGYTLETASGRAVPVVFSEAEIEKLSRMEHDRWMQQKLDGGWKYAPVTDKSKKLHKDLIPWEQLSPDDKDKDRTLVRNIPHILARAGYVVIKRRNFLKS